MNPAAQWNAINNRANEFLADVLSGQQPRSGGVLAFPTDCTGQNPAGDPETSSDWDHLAHGALVATSSSSRGTTSFATNPAAGILSDPVIVGQPNVCAVESDLPGTAAWKWPVPDTGFTLLGLPKVSVSYSMTGEDATAVFKLWDVAPSGLKTLVTRGVYRLTHATDPMPEGALSTKLFGNDYRFEAGHEIELEVSQTDAPFFRPDNFPSTITFASLRLALPIREGVTQHIGAP
jgi:hypothetical protein